MLTDKNDLYTLAQLNRYIVEMLAQIQAHSSFVVSACFVAVNHKGNLSIAFPLNSSIEVAGEERRVGVSIVCEALELKTSVSQAAARVIRDAEKALQELLSDAA